MDSQTTDSAIKNEAFRPSVVKMEENDDLAANSMSTLAHQRLNDAKKSLDATELREVNAKTTHLLSDMHSALTSILDLRRVKQWRDNIEKLIQDSDLLPPKFLQTPESCEVSDKTKVMEEAECAPFYTEIQVFVDPESKRNVPGAEFEDAEPQELEMANWSLIKVVPGFLKSEVVSTGMVIPRGRHSNATRATVATKYLKERSRLWMVAPITRTVDDKTAKTLVEDRCTQQLKYDEAYSNITFVCSRADDVSLDEAAPSFGIVNSMEKE
ncbi:hypothetical protein SGCOL_006052 [Colletotrichum sp. CLE4]